LCIFNSHPRLHPACSPPSQNFSPQNLSTSPPLLPSGSSKLSVLSLSRQRSPQPPASDLHGRLQHLISLRPRPRPPKRRAAGARGPYSRTASVSTGLHTLGLPYSGLLWLTSFYTRTAPNHRTTAPPPRHQKAPTRTQPALALTPTTFFLSPLHLPIWAAASYRALSLRQLHTTPFVVHRDASQSITRTSIHLW
jgi:hypothetical protein